MIRSRYQFSRAGRVTLLRHHEKMRMIMMVMTMAMTLMMMITMMTLMVKLCHDENMVMTICIQVGWWRGLEVLPDLSA